eukprot:Tbor_TRINITY_DN7480_c0_g1::TRINITY_DN7480_c0_g1_i1::g.14514::m.14514/K12619/XRN2, RAT1; 5'-3' exoribonuclease 2
MGIAGFYLWLQRFYKNCVDDIPDVDILKSFSSMSPDNSYRLPVYDNLYLDMNGLIHPCCHDTAPEPEPESEEEMFERIFRTIDKLITVVKPRKCLVMAIDGVAPRSKMNQQRTRRFRAARERKESNEIMERCSETIVKEYNLPRPETKERWDHNVITPSTAFMERVGQAIEWYTMKKMNEDPSWAHLTVVFSDAHVPGEGEHKVMHYIRGLRSQPGYNPNTSHCIYGMDADLICLGLATHEPNFGILRNQLNEDFKPDGNKFCYFNLCKFRQALKQDFSDIVDMDFERVIDDFVFLCFFVGNDFLPHLPLVSIKTKGIELLLHHYVKYFDDHLYLTKRGEVNFRRLGKFISAFDKNSFKELSKEYTNREQAKERAKMHVDDRVTQCQSVLESALLSLKADKTNAQEISNKVFQQMCKIQREILDFVADKEPLTFSYANRNSRDKYYETKFGWDSSNSAEFESKIAQCCREFYRGMQWVMRYYTKGCPSWEWFYPFHYAPLLQDMGNHCSGIDVEMRMSAPLNPVEQLLAVLPRESVAALPEELHEAVEDRKSVLAKFYPTSFKVDFSEALFAYQGVALLPFIPVDKLQKACRKVVDLEPDMGTSLIYARADANVTNEISLLLENAETAAITSRVTKVTPIAGRVGRYQLEWPLNSVMDCPDEGLAHYCKEYGSRISVNRVRTFSYELSAHVDYDEQLLSGAKEHLASFRSTFRHPQPRRGPREKRTRDEDCGQEVANGATDMDTSRVPEHSVNNGNNTYHSHNTGRKRARH